MQGLKLAAKMMALPACRTYLGFVGLVRGKWPKHRSLTMLETDELDSLLTHHVKWPDFFNV